MVNQPNALLTVETKWCGTVILRPDRWQHATEHHPEVAPYIAHVQTTLERPNLVCETLHRKPTMVFYASGLITDNPLYQGCYVAVYVRYKMDPSCVWTVYLPTRLANDQGRIHHIER
jgi:hypothetical protein